MLEAVGTQGVGAEVVAWLFQVHLFAPSASHLQPLTFLSHLLVLPDCHMAPPGLLDGAGKAIKLSLSHLF